MSIHKVTLIVDEGWMVEINKLLEYADPREVFTWVSDEEIPSIECPTCAREVLEDDLIPCNVCSTPLCEWCQDDSNYPRTGTKED